MGLTLHGSSACDVCFEGFSDACPPFSITCGHSFCGQCLQSLSPQSCPLCRSSFDAVDIRKICVDAGSEDERQARTLETKIADVSAGEVQDMLDVIREVREWLRDQPEEKHHILRARFLLLWKFYMLVVTYVQEQEKMEKMTAHEKSLEESIKQADEKYQQAEAEWNARHEALQRKYDALQEEMKQKTESLEREAQQAQPAPQAPQVPATSSELPTRLKTTSFSGGKLPGPSNSTTLTHSHPTSKDQIIATSNHPETSRSSLEKQKAPPPVTPTTATATRSEATHVPSLSANTTEQSKATAPPTVHSEPPKPAQPDPPKIEPQKPVQSHHASSSKDPVPFPTSAYTVPPTSRSDANKATVSSTHPGAATVTNAAPFPSTSKEPQISHIPTASQAYAYRPHKVSITRASREPATSQDAGGPINPFEVAAKAVAQSAVTVATNLASTSAPQKVPPSASSSHVPPTLPSSSSSQKTVPNRSNTAPVTTSAPVSTRPVPHKAATSSARVSPIPPSAPQAPPAPVPVATVTSTRTSPVPPIASTSSAPISASTQRSPTTPEKHSHPPRVSPVPPLGRTASLSYKPGPSGSSRPSLDPTQTQPKSSNPSAFSAAAAKKSSHGVSPYATLPRKQSGSSYPAAFPDPPLQSTARARDLRPIAMPVPPQIVMGRTHTPPPLPPRLVARQEPRSAPVSASAPAPMPPLPSFGSTRRRGSEERESPPAATGDREDGLPEPPRLLIPSDPLAEPLLPIPSGSRAYAIASGLPRPPLILS